MPRLDHLSKSLAVECIYAIIADFLHVITSITSFLETFSLYMTIAYSA